MSHLLNRRNIVKLAGVLPVVTATAAAADEHSHGFRVQFFGEGVIPVVPWPFIAPPPPLPPEIAQEIALGRLEARLRATLASDDRKIVRVQVYLAPPSSPLPAPQDPPYTTLPTTARFDIQLREVILTGSPATVLAAGTVISDVVVSPYGPFAGRSAAVTFGLEMTATRTSRCSALRSQAVTSLIARQQRDRCTSEVLIESFRRNTACAAG